MEENQKDLSKHKGFFISNSVTREEIFLQSMLTDFQ